MPVNRDFKDLFSAFSAADNRIDILTEVEGLSFAEAWSDRQMSSYGSVPIGLLNLDDLMTSKRAAGRPQDRLDLEWLEKAKKSGRPPGGD
jgi:hypothetical protein